MRKTEEKIEDRIEDTAETLRHPNVVGYKKVSDEQIKRAKEILKITKEKQKKIADKYCIFTFS